MDLGHLVEQIVAYVTSITDLEIEGSFQTAEEKGPTGEREIGHYFTV